MKVNNTLSRIKESSRRTYTRILFVIPVLILFAGIANAASAGAQSQLNTPVLSLNGTSFNTGNVITLNAFASGGTPPYTYTFVIENAATKAVLASSGSMLNSNTFSVSASTILNGEDLALVEVSDSSTPSASVSSASSAFMVNATQKITSTPAVPNNPSGQGSQPSGTIAPPASTSAAGVGIVVIILLAVFGIFLYGRNRKQ